MNMTTGFSDFFYSITTKSGFSIATALLSNVILAGAVAAQTEAAGADFSAPVDVRQLTVTQVVVTSLTLDLPAPGVVIVNSGGYAIFNANPPASHARSPKAQTLVTSRKSMRKTTMIRTPSGCR